LDACCVDYLEHAISITLIQCKSRDEPNYQEIHI
jgi:hypothetical protein